MWWPPHADINDEGQTVTFGKPSIGTTATIDGDKTAEPAEQITITDTVEYSGLTVGQEYTLRGELVFQATGEPVMSDEEPVTAEATFIPVNPTARWMCCSLSTLLGSKRHPVVVLRTLLQGDTEIASHEDIEDEGQTVTFTETPQIGTTATVDGAVTLPTL